MPSPRPAPLRMPRGVTDEQAKRIVKRYQKGESFESLGRAYGFSPYKAKSIVRYVAGDGALRTRRPPLAAMDEESRAKLESEFLAAYRDTSTRVIDILRDFRIGYTTVHNILAAHGEPSRAPRRG